MLNDESTSRRSFLQWLGGTAMTAAMSGPLISGCSSNPGSESGPAGTPSAKVTPQKLTTLAQLKKTGFETVSWKDAGGNSVSGIVLLGESDSLEAFDTTCPHMGCQVAYQPDKSRFYCPCHEGVFDKSGQVVSGPPPEGLSRLKVTYKAEDDGIWLVN
jgi:Rieske Fe-S protein